MIDTDKDKFAENDSDSAFLDEVHTRYQLTKNAWSTIFDHYSSDVAFENGDMWDGGIKKIREEEGLSCLTVNKITDKIKYIVNNARSNMPAIKVHAISDGASENTAKVFDGIIKGIENKYNAKQARINAHKTNVIGGLGAWKVLPFEDDRGEYDIKYERILDPTTILIDPNAIEQDYSDAEYAFVVKWISKSAFKRKYPKINIDTFDSTYKDWYSKEAVQVIEYWCRGEDNLFDYYIINADNILESNKDYLGKYLPIMFLTGSEYNLNGDKDFKGVVRDIKDMQILHNLTKSRFADYIARSAEAQWLAEVEQIADHPEWDKNNVSGAAVLTYSGTTSGGKPTRNDPLPPPTGLIESSTETEEDIRRMIGIRDPLADIPSSQSGKAIALQISQSNIGTFEYADKLNDLIKYEGKVMVDLISKYISYPHIREVFGLDGSVSTVQLNQTYIENGEQVMHDLSKGNYLVTLSTGASYESQKSETSDMLIELSAKNPQIMQLAGDIIVKNMDFVGADELADRLKAAIPPNILAASNATNGDKPEAQLANVQAQMAQMGQQMQEMQIALQQAQALNAQLQQDQQTKATEMQVKTQAEMAIMDAKNRADLVAMQTKAQFEEHVLALKNAHEKEMKLLELQLTGAQKIEQLHVKGDIDAKLEDVKADNAASAADAQAVYNAHASDLNAEHEINKIHVQNHAEVFLRQMEAEIEIEAKKQTGIDVID